MAKIKQSAGGDDQKRFEGLMNYYRDRVIGAKCNSVRLKQALDDLCEFMCEEIKNEKRAKKRTEKHNFVTEGKNGDNPI